MLLLLENQNWLFYYIFSYSDSAFEVWIVKSIRLNQVIELK